jgi:Rubredoxin-like zinc ribbon domain (DUF35_N)
MSAPQLPAPHPAVNPETRPFWDATARGQLLLRRCRSCTTVNWYPDCDVGALQIGDPVEVTFHDTGQGAARPRFRPAGR